VRYAIRPMTAADAQAVAAWRYPGEYRFYDVDQDPDDLAELLDPAEWGTRYFAAERYGAARTVLAVAAFNQRAITLYERAGFRAVERYEHATNGGVHLFIRLER
jgi:[ribosomal protein S18]-alanine N-acetyltransferase